ncbi:MAG: hypothetical protein QMB94_09395 [Phycisphaerales bacterium]
MRRTTESAPVTIRMHGIPTPSQTFCAKAPAIEAKVRFDLGDQTLTRWVHADSSDLTAQDHRVHPDSAN